MQRVKYWKETVYYGSATLEGFVFACGGVSTWVMLRLTCATLAPNLPRSHSDGHGLVCSVRNAAISDFLVLFSCSSTSHEYWPSSTTSLFVDLLPSSIHLPPLLASLASLAVLLARFLQYGAVCAACIVVGSSTGLL